MTLTWLLSLLNTMKQYFLDDPLSHYMAHALLEKTTTRGRLQFSGQIIYK